MTPLNKCLFEKSYIKLLEPKGSLSYSVKKLLFTPINKSNLVKPIPKTIRHPSHIYTKQISNCLSRPSIDLLRMMELLIEAKKNGR